MPSDFHLSELLKKHLPGKWSATDAIKQQCPFLLETTDTTLLYTEI